MTLEEWQARCETTSSTDRGEILSEALEDHLAGEPITLEELATLMGTWWQTCDSYPQLLIYSMTEQLYFAGDAFTVPAAKASNSLEFYQAIPDGKLIVYRGCFEGIDEMELTWCTSKEIAQTWPFAPGKQIFSKPILIEGEIEKKDILMAFSDKGQSEVVIESDCITEISRTDLDSLKEQIIKDLENKQ